MLNIRLRGATWHARGTVRVGTKTVKVDEFSTGCDLKSDARAVAAAKEAEIRKDLLDGGEGRKSRVTIDDCLHVYLKRAMGLEEYDKVRVRKFSDIIGTYLLTDLPEAWAAWLDTRIDAGPATLARERGILQSAIKIGCTALKALPYPKVPGVQQPKGERVVYLTDAERTRLLASYNRSAGRVALMLAYQGMRTSEATQLHWRAVEMKRKTIRVIDTESKTKKGRTLPIHPVVFKMLTEMWDEREAKIAADLSKGIKQEPYKHVFLSERGAPYTDTRKCGGSPLTKAHQTACKLAKISDFHPHDWRHDWATRLVQGGVDLVSLKKLGGWSSLKMVERYASFGMDHLREAILKIA